MSAAPYPSDTRAKGWRFELNTEQAKKSDTWLRARSGYVRAHLLLLWAEAWEQTPCGSLPNDDELIALLLDMDMADFAKHKAVLLRGWWLADDGRLYHDTIAARVLSMMGKRRSDADRLSAKRRAESEGGRGDVAATKTNVATTPTGVRPESNTEDRGPRTEDHAPAVGPAAPPIPPASDAAAPAPAAPKPKRAAKPKDPPLTAATWDAYRAAYRVRYGVDPSRSAVLNAQLATLVKKIGSDDAPAVATFYVSHNRSDYVRATHDTALLVRDAAGLRTQWATQRQVTNTQANNADRTQTNANAFGPLIAEARAREAADGQREAA